MGWPIQSAQLGVKVVPLYTLSPGRKGQIITVHVNDRKTARTQSTGRTCTGTSCKTTAIWVKCQDFLVSPEQRLVFNLKALCYADSALAPLWPLQWQRGFQDEQAHNGFTLYSC